MYGGTYHKKVIEAFENLNGASIPYGGINAGVGINSLLAPNYQQSASSNPTISYTVNTGIGDVQQLVNATVTSGPSNYALNLQITHGLYRGPYGPGNNYSNLGPRLSHHATLATSGMVHRSWAQTISDLNSLKDANGDSLFIPGISSTATIEDVYQRMIAFNGGGAASNVECTPFIYTISHFCLNDTIYDDNVMYNSNPPINVYTPPQPSTNTGNSGSNSGSNNNNNISV